MIFKDLLEKAKSGNRLAVEKLLIIYQPLLLKESIVKGVHDEDLYQELCIVFLQCIEKFNP